MKFVKTIIIFLCLFLTTVSAFSQTNAYSVYSLDATKNFHGQQSAFTIKTNTLVLNERDTDKSQHPVNIKTGNQFHTVSIGTISGAKKVRHESQKRDGSSYKSRKIERKPNKLKAVKNSKIDSLPQKLSTWHPFLNANISTFDLDIPQSMQVNNGAPYPAPYNLDRYTVNKKTQTALSLVAGFKKEYVRQWLPSYSLGLLIQHLFNKSITGYIVQYSLPQFTNYHYHWDISSDLLALYSKVDITKYHGFTPFVNVGLGLSVNKASNVEEIALDNITPRVGPGFGGKQHGNF